jgi:hypothetical protein
MPLTPARRVLLGVAVTVMVVLTTGGNDPPVDIAGGSIYGTTQFWHIWHQLPNDASSYNVVRMPDNTQVIITDGDKNILLACTAPRWVVSLYQSETDLLPTAKLCTNNDCDVSKSVDGDGNIYLKSYAFTSSAAGAGRKRWHHSYLGLAWWKIQFEEDNVHINRVELATAGSSGSANSCPESWPNATSKRVTDFHWHVQTGAAPKYR